MPRGNTWNPRSRHCTNEYQPQRWSLPGQSIPGGPRRRKVRLLRTPGIFQRERQLEHLLQVAGQVTVLAYLPCVTTCDQTAMQIPHLNPPRDPLLAKEGSPMTKSLRR